MIERTDFFLFAAAATALLTLLVGMPFLLWNSKQIESSFEERCRMDNGVVIQAQKLFCVKQSAIVETNQ